MKKLIIAILGAFIMVVGCTSTTDPPKTTELSFFTPYQGAIEYLNGQIKSVEEMNYLVTIVDGDKVKGDLLNKEMRDSLRWSINFMAVFNENGDITKVDRYYDDGDIRQWKVEYNGDQITKASFVLGDTVRYYYDNIEYNELGFISTGEYFRAKDDQHLYTYKYTTNENGVWNGGTNFNAEGEKIAFYTMDLNDKNLTLNYKSYNQNDSLLSETITTYNDKGFYTKAEYMNGIGELRRTIELKYTKYDEMGNWLEANMFDNGDLFLIAERKYVYY